MANITTKHRQGRMMPAHEILNKEAIHTRMLDLRSKGNYQGLSDEEITEIISLANDMLQKPDYKHLTRTAAEQLHRDLFVRLRDEKGSEDVPVNTQKRHVVASSPGDPATTFIPAAGAGAPEPQSPRTTGSISPDVIQNSGSSTKEPLKKPKSRQKKASLGTHLQKYIIGGVVRLGNNEDLEKALENLSSSKEINYLGFYDGLTPLMRAILQGNETKVGMLMKDRDIDLSKKAGKFIKDGEDYKSEYSELYRPALNGECKGKTALEIAKAHAVHKSMVKLVESYSQRSNHNKNSSSSTMFCDSHASGKRQGPSSNPGSPR